MTLWIAETKKKWNKKRCGQISWVYYIVNKSNLHFCDFASTALYMINIWYDIRFQDLEYADTNKMTAELRPPDYKPPEYKPPKICIKMGISPGVILGILRYTIYGRCPTN